MLANPYLDLVSMTLLTRIWKRQPNAVILMANIYQNKAIQAVTNGGQN
jgi:hypothetical protein